MDGGVDMGGTLVTGETVSVGTSPPNFQDVTLIFIHHARIGPCPGWDVFAIRLKVYLEAAPEKTHG